VNKLAFCIAVFATLMTNGQVDAAQDNPTHPVVLIPGILGSKLCSSDGTVLWGGTGKASLSNFHRLDVSTEAAGAVKPCGLIDSVQVLGPLYSVAAYSSLLKAMGEWKLVEGQNLFIFDYDWRLSNIDNAAAFEQFVAAKLGPEAKFNIVAHSMGGFIARLYMERQQDNRRVNKIIYLGTPFLGSMSTLGTLSEGWGRLPNWLAGGIDAIRRVTLSFPSLLEMLPRYDNCCSFKTANNQYTAIDVFDPQLWKSNSWLPADMKDGPRFAQFSSNLKRASTMSPVLRTPSPGAIEVRFASDVRSTRFIFVAQEGQTNPGPANWHFSLERGDATVPAWSAARDTQLRTLAGTLQSFGEHSTIFDDDWVRSELKRELFDAVAVIDRPIAGKGSPVIAVTVAGQRREWPLEQVQVTPAETYLTENSTIEATVVLRFSGNARDFDSGLYKPRVFVRQNGTAVPLNVIETTTTSDKSNRRLAFRCHGETRMLDEGVIELVVELPSAQPKTEAKEFLVLLK
jgi:pimeloyl-ACP methyl ester carboxylesterase